MVASARIVLLWFADPLPPRPSGEGFGREGSRRGQSAGWGEARCRAASAAKLAFYMAPGLGAARLPPCQPALLPPPLPLPLHLPLPARAASGATTPPQPRPPRRPGLAWCAWVSPASPPPPTPQALAGVRTGKGELVRGGRQPSPGGPGGCKGARKQPAPARSSSALPGGPSSSRSPPPPPAAPAGERSQRRRRPCFARGRALTRDGRSAGRPGLRGCHGRGISLWPLPAGKQQVSWACRCAPAEVLLLSSPVHWPPPWPRPQLAAGAQLAPRRCPVGGSGRARCPTLPWARPARRIMDRGLQPRTLSVARNVRCGRLRFAVPSSAGLCPWGSGAPRCFG